MITVYGIPNCDTMKKARRWLAVNDIEDEFHDYKNLGVNEQLLSDWIKQVGWEKLFNRRGMMWRKLDESTKNNIDEQSAIQVMLETPSIIKRPVMVLDDGTVQVGFSEPDYQVLLG